MTDFLPITIRVPVVDVERWREEAGRNAPPLDNQLVQGVLEAAGVFSQAYQGTWGLPFLTDDQEAQTITEMASRERFNRQSVMDWCLERYGVEFKYEGVRYLYDKCKRAKAVNHGQS